jgi:peroxiredoxin
MSVSVDMNWMDKVRHNRLPSQTLLSGQHSTKPLNERVESFSFFWHPPLMSTIANNSMPIGHFLPSFALPDVVRGTLVSHQEVCGKRAVLIMFVCRHCPYVAHVLKELIRLASDYQSRGAAFVAISSNDGEKYPEDAPAMLRQMAIEHALPFPLLFDQSQEVAKAFAAVCTPDFFLFNSKGQLVYHGCLDESTPGNGLPVTGENLRAALDATLADKPIPERQIPSVGCSIKWLQ